MNLGERTAATGAHTLASALRALKREPLPVLLATLVLALGVAAFTTFLTPWRALASNPAGGRGERLYNVQLDNWAAGSPYVHDGEPPKLLTLRDAQALYDARRAPAQLLMFPGQLPIAPQGAPAFTAPVRFTSHEFFAFFAPRFRYGHGWSDPQDRDAARVVVLTRDMNRRLFDDADSTGRTLRIGDEDFRILGVLEDWHPVPRWYDVTLSPLMDPEDFYAPFAVGIARGLRSAQSNDCWAPLDKNDPVMAHGECVWINFWIQADTPLQAQDYRAFLDDYARAQKAQGRFPQPLNNRLLKVRDWLDHSKVVEPQLRTQALLALAFLAVCVANAAALLSARFLARMPRIAVQRALGASRRRVYFECAVEAAMVGLGGGVLGSSLSAVALAVTRVLTPGFEHAARLGAEMVGLSLMIAMAAALAAAAWPTWRAAHVPPAGFLRSGT